jgi:hypothetical protein
MAIDPGVKKTPGFFFPSGPSERPSHADGSDIWFFFI